MFILAVIGIVVIAVLIIAGPKVFGRLRNPK